MRSFLLLFLLFVPACAGDPGEFRPAKNAPDQPAVKDAFRVKSVASDCVALGVVHAEGFDPVPDIAKTAARHGANTYIVRGDDRDERILAESNHGHLATRTNHKMWAEAYRCPTADAP